MTGETIRVSVGRGLEMSCEISGDGIPLVLIHGLMGSARTWDAVREKLGTADYRVLAPELIGFGNSSRTLEIDKLWAENQAASILAAMDAAGFAEAVVAGHDFGGPTSLWMHRLAPERVKGLVLVSTNLTNDTPIPFPIKMVTWPLLGHAMAGVLFSRPSMKVTLGKAVGPGGPTLPAGEYFGDAAQLGAIRTLFTVALRELRERYGPVMEELGKVRVPCEVSWGDRDPFFSPAQGERTASLIKGAKLEMLSGCGHFAPEERPSEVAASIERVAQTAFVGGEADR